MPWGKDGSGGGGERYTSADKSKLDGIEAGAEVNPKHVVNFRTEDGSNANNAGLMFLIKSDNSQWQSGNASDNLAAIGFNGSQFNLTQNPQVDNATYTGFHSLLDDKAENGSSVLIFLYYMGSGLSVPNEVTGIVQAERTVKNDDSTYALQNLAIIKDFSVTGTGNNWQITIIEASYAAWDSVIGVPDYVEREQLAGKETDRYASYTNGFIGSGYRNGAWCLFNQAGAPETANAVRQPDIVDGSGAVAFGAILRTDRDPNHYQAAPANTAADYPSGRVIHASIWNKPGARLVITLTSDGTLVGTGDAAYIWANASWDEVEDVSNVVQYGDYFLLADEQPSSVPIRITGDEILGDIDGSQIRLAGVAADPITGQSKLVVYIDDELQLLSIDHLERHFADRYRDFGDYSIVASGSYDAKGEIDASQLNNANKQIRLGVTDSTLADFGEDIVSGVLVELYKDADNYLIGRVNTVTGDSLRTAINGKYVRLTTLEIVGSVGAGDTVNFRQYVQGDGLVPVPTQDDVGKVLKATGINEYAWVDVLDAAVRTSVTGTESPSNTWTAIATGLDSGDDLIIGVSYTGGNNLFSNTTFVRFGDVPLSTDSPDKLWSTDDTEDGRRVQYQRDGTTLNAQSAGSAGNVVTLVQKV